MRSCTNACRHVSRSFYTWGCLISAPSRAFSNFTFTHNWTIYALKQKTVRHERTCLHVCLHIAHSDSRRDRRMSGSGFCKEGGREAEAERKWQISAMFIFQKIYRFLELADLDVWTFTSSGQEFWGFCCSELFEKSSTTWGSQAPRVYYRHSKWRSRKAVPPLCIMIF